MSEADDREAKLIRDAVELRDWYRLYKSTSVVTLFAEDFDFLKRRKKIIETEAGTFLDGEIAVKRGYRRRKPGKKRPPELFA